MRSTGFSMGLIPFFQGNPSISEQKVVVMDLVATSDLKACGGPKRQFALAKAQLFMEASASRSVTCVCVCFKGWSLSWCLFF